MRLVQMNFLGRIHCPNIPLVFLPGCLGRSLAVLGKLLICLLLIGYLLGDVERFAKVIGVLSVEIYCTDGQMLLLFFFYKPIILYYIIWCVRNHLYFSFVWIHGNVSFLYHLSRNTKPLKYSLKAWIWAAKLPNGNILACVEIWKLSQYHDVSDCSLHNN